ncbi:hypothetical protein GYMLUDRAFT_87947 [Collybiopsis luxurians FD-317 M1]|uniref:DUF159-domain-containing protein n=1 Tax=Collybiopsis luxurians FD-317 M1 TaxID=944289 RepID=A0A0D0AVQ8_9AGAR|nr:hypothetical protein GYMLUDRAFT_87947 [Collybiopsis luxurians FD-317 M1]
MCGRFSLRLAHQEIQEVQGYNLDHINEWINRDHFVPRYNIAPRSQAPVIRRRNPGGADASNEYSPNQLVMQTMKWGLVPHWSKFEDKNLNTMNARSENLISGGGMWNSIKGRKRCVVVCQGYHLFTHSQRYFQSFSYFHRYYEWLSKGRDKLPHFTKPKNGKVMLLAGLYDSVQLQDQSDTLWSFTIVTTTASNEFSWLHDRQPVILSTREDLDQWLDTSSQKWSEDLVKIVSRAYTKDSPLECYQVPKEVGKVGTESSSFILPIAARKDGIEAMFSKQKQAQPSSSKRKREMEEPKREAVAKADESEDDIEILDSPPSGKKAFKTLAKWLYLLVHLLWRTL